MNRCEDFEILASATIDNETSSDERKALFGHLSHCERCSSFFTQALRIQFGAARNAVTPMPLGGRDPDVMSAHHTPWTAMQKVMEQRVSIPIPALGLGVALVAIVILALSQPREMMPLEPPVQQAQQIQQTQQVGTDQAILSLPVVKIP